MIGMAMAVRAAEADKNAMKCPWCFAVLHFEGYESWSIGCSSAKDWCPHCRERILVACEKTYSVERVTDVDLHVYTFRKPGACGNGRGE